jgi:hypothetical protein
MSRIINVTIIRGVLLRYFQLLVIELSVTNVNISLHKIIFMNNKVPLKLLYGNANFKSVRTENNYAYVVKTRCNPRYSQVKYEWALEIKYCKTDATESEISAKCKEGLEQLNQYINLLRLKDRPQLKSALIIFIGKDKYEIFEN